MEKKQLGRIFLDLVRMLYLIQNFLKLPAKFEFPQLPNMIFLNEALVND